MRRNAVKSGSRKALLAFFEAAGCCRHFAVSALRLGLFAGGAVLAPPSAVLGSS